MKKIIFLLSMLLIISMLFTACGSAESTDSGSENDKTDSYEEQIKDIPTDPVSVVINVQHFGEITVELYPEHAPLTVTNFLKLVDSKFYDGLTFHRIMKGFMIQGGDPKGDGTGDADETIKGEFSENGVDNPLSHTRGTISMARGSHSMDSASCQFFICDADSLFLDGQYAAFGKVTEGMDVVDAIADVAVDYNSAGEKSVPINTITIESIRRK